MAILAMGVPAAGLSETNSPPDGAAIQSHPHAPELNSVRPRAERIALLFMFRPPTAIVRAGRKKNRGAR